MATQETSNTSELKNFTPPGRDIVLIHGLWLTPLCWENWIKRFNEHGYNVIAPAWPGLEDRTIDDIRKDPTLLRGLGVEEIVNHYDKIIRSLSRAPIIMGHSMGGLITQLLLDRGLGCSGVAIDSVQTRGVLNLPLSTIRVAWPILSNPLDTNGITELTLEQFRFAFTNNLSEEESREVFEKFSIPGPKRPLLQAAFANFNPNAVTKVNYENINRAPLLFVASGNDHTVPASINKENANRYKTTTITDYREFPERTHYTFGETGWEEVADFCLNWAVDQTDMFESQAVLH
ncbi:alpha/beta hydrolase [Peredibacter starrii]|uniref:Alpha/beta hydrolase n=1 Tax=Peredibacter starrii TaxID=28202 RepID=A0AAX4HMC4_9BACT|nr:alpha/beta hydrolase [Peredibacter starrii]WPU64307.1 alpha/beta hydrolase [Peredibacter starrii]